MNTIIQISAGKGPAECHWVVAQTHKKMIQDAKDRGLKVETIAKSQGFQGNTLLSAVLSITGSNAVEFVAYWEGIIQWVGTSPYRKYHKRKNWFISVKPYQSVGNKPMDVSSIKMETFRSGGPGGQHVNKVSTAVRVTHLPTGLSATCSETRSQLQNKKRAIEKLKSLLDEKEKTENLDNANANWMQHNTLQRGGAKRVFEGVKFKFVK